MEKIPPPPKTGWPPPALMQDDHRGLFRWFASRPDARRMVRESVHEIETRSRCASPVLKPRS